MKSAYSLTPISSSAVCHYGNAPYSSSHSWVSFQLRTNLPAVFTQSHRLLIIFCLVFKLVCQHASLRAVELKPVRGVNWLRILNSLMLQLGTKPVTMVTKLIRNWLKLKCTLILTTACCISFPWNVISGFNFVASGTHSRFWIFAIGCLLLKSTLGVEVKFLPWCLMCTGLYS